MPLIYHKTTAPCSLDNSKYVTPDGAVSTAFWIDMFDEAVPRLKMGTVGTITTPVSMLKNQLMSRLYLATVAAGYPKINYTIDLYDPTKVYLKLRGNSRFATARDPLGKPKKKKKIKIKSSTPLAWTIKTKGRANENDDNPKK